MTCEVKDFGTNLISEMFDRAGRATETAPLEHVCPQDSASRIVGYSAQSTCSTSGEVRCLTDHLRAYGGEEIVDMGSVII